MPHRRPSSDSRCSQPAGAPYRWYNYVDLAHPSVIKLDGFLGSLIPPVRAMEEGEIEDLFDAASAGLLEEDSDEYVPLRPIVSDPDMYELRLKSLRTYRFYHGEPERYPDLLLKLHRHIKDEDTNQQTEIDHAIDRYRRKES